jgi:hypothetical protein
MRLVIPHTSKLRPEVKQLGESLNAEFVEVGHCELAYYCLIAKKWARAESFVLIEHDVLATPELLDEIWNCPEPWCAGFSWAYHGAVLPGEDRPHRPGRDRVTALMLNKFDGSLLQRMGTIPRGPLTWQQLDLYLLSWLAQSAQPHLHGPVLHLHQKHPAWALTMTEDDWRRIDA